MKEIITENQYIPLEYISKYLEEDFTSDFSLISETYDPVCEINSFDFGNLLHETGFNEYFF
jgi:hypothetical protein